MDIRIVLSMAITQKKKAIRQFGHSIHLEPFYHAKKEGYPLDSSFYPSHFEFYPPVIRLNKEKSTHLLIGRLIFLHGYFCWIPCTNFS